jgi:biotin carboxyl carrier protein
MGADWRGATVNYRVLVEGRPYLIEIRDDGTVWVNGLQRDVDLSESSGQPFHSLLLDGHSYETQLRELDGGRTEIVVDGRTYRTQLTTGRLRAPPHVDECTSDPGETRESQAWVTAPLPGLLVETRAANGDQVEEGDVVVVLESMKMHLELRAPRDGTVTCLDAIPGQEVDLDEVLAIIV